jgi:hypothetical protein
MTGIMNEAVCSVLAEAITLSDQLDLTARRS